jgi:hypothetical protein
MLRRKTGGVDAEVGGGIQLSKVWKVSLRWSELCSCVEEARAAGAKVLRWRHRQEAGVR